MEGVTRRSVLDLTREWNEIQVTEGKFTMPQVVRALQEGRVYEMFGSGTAATVAPLGQIKYQGKWITPSKTATAVLNTTM